MSIVLVSKRSSVWPMERIFSRSRIGQDRLAHFQPLAPRRADEVEDVRPRPDEGDQAHHQFLADRVDRRVGDLGEILLEIGVEQLRLVRHRRDRRVGAHRADGFLAGRRHRRHQQLGVFLAVAEGLLAIEQGDVLAQRARLDRLEFLQDELGVGEPALVGVPGRDLRLDLLVGDDAALFQVDQQHAARLQPPLLDDVFSSGHGSTPASEAMMTRSSSVTM